MPTPKRFPPFLGAQKTPIRFLSIFHCNIIPKKYQAFHGGFKDIFSVFVGFFRLFSFTRLRNAYIHL